MLKKLRFILVFVSLSICLCLMSSTYSRYVADTTGNVEALFAKWQILVSNTDITSNSDSTIQFTPTFEENENVANNAIAPNSKGYFDIDIDPTNVDVSFGYTIDLGIANEDMPDIKMTAYSIIPNTYVEGDPLDRIQLEGNTITNTLSFNKTDETFKFDTFTVRIYFEWYEGADETMNDAADTAIGHLAASEGKAFAMNANISFEQIIE